MERHYSTCVTSSHGASLEQPLTEDSEVSLKVTFRPLANRLFPEGRKSEIYTTSIYR